MMYDDMRMTGYYQPTTSLWESGHWKMEPPSPPSPPPPVPSSPFVDLDTDSWFQDGGGLAATANNVHNQQNNLLEQHHHYYAGACESPDLIVPDTSAANYGAGDVTQKFHLDDVITDADKPATRGEAAQKLLNDLDEWIKEEPFSDWYEEKIDLPIFEELETVQPTPVATAAAPLITRRSDVPALLCHNTKMASSVGVQHHYAKMASPGAVQYAKMAAAATQIPVALIGGGGPPQPQPSLMQEFDFVLSHHHHQEQNMLTPPESPERVGAVEGGMTMLQNMPTEELDELVRIRVESLVEGGEDSQCSSYSPSAGEEECLSSSGSECGRSPAPSLEDSCSGSDPEWSPHSATKSDGKQPAGGGPAATQSKRRRQSGSAKPYQRPPPEEKRQRKKEQNKNAATRYRLKKKAEIEEILGEERGLMDKNQQLKTDVGELEREIKYLKSLMREMLRRKKVIK